MSESMRQEPVHDTGADPVQTLRQVSAASDRPSAQAAAAAVDALVKFLHTASAPKPVAAPPAEVVELRPVPEPEPVAPTEVEEVVEAPEPEVAPELPAPAAVVDFAPLPVGHAAEVEPEPEPEPEPELRAEPEPAVPFWKREITLGRKQQQPKPKAKQAKTKPPIWKRKLDLAAIANKPIGHQEGTTEGLEKLVGLRIGSTQLAAALVSNNGSASLERVACTPLRPGLVVGGEVHDLGALASALKSFFSQHKLPRRGVRIGVAANRIGVRVIEVPAIDDPKAAANAIRFRAQEVLPFALAEAVVDHVDLGEGPNGTRRVLIAFAHRALIDQYVEACRRAKLKLAGIDFEAFALLRAVAAKRAHGDEPTSALVALAIGHERTIFAVSDGEVCEFARVLDWGSGAIDAELARALEVSADEAAQLKLSLALEGDDDHPELTPVQLEVARNAMREGLQQLARELVASLQFYQSRPGSLDIGDVLVTGGGAGLGGLADELTRTLGVPVRTADPFAGVHVAPDVAVPDHGGSLAIAVGLAIEEQH